VNKFNEIGGLEKIISSIKNLECSLDVLFLSFKIIGEIYKFINGEFSVKFLDQFIEYSNQYLTKYFTTDKIFKNENTNKLKNVPKNNKNPSNENDDDINNKFYDWYKEIKLLISIRQYTYIIVEHLEIDSYYAIFFLEIGVNCLMKSKEACNIVLAIRIIIDVLSKINIKSLPCFEEIKKIINKKNLITNLLEVFQYENIS